MKKVVNVLTITGFMFFGAIQSFAQEAAEKTEEAKTFHQELKQRFIEGDPSFMGIVLVALILGLAIAIERIIYLNIATTNTKKLVASVDDALSSGGIEAASSSAVEPPVERTRPANPKFCSHCGTALLPSARFCVGCGKAVVEQMQQYV